jgi:pyruvate ferredoxin oxidoreductase alpha subunit
MSAAIGAALAGARTMTATSSQGMALMAEMVYIAAGMRAPIVMAVGNRALSSPINIHGDHSDSMLVRDSGCIQLFARSAQEAYDLMVLAPRLAEHPDVLLPVLVCQDGFTVTHSAEPVELLADDVVKGFVGDYTIPYPLLDLAHRVTQGPFAMPDAYFELRRAQAAAIEAAAAVFAALAEELETLSGRRLAAIEEYRLHDADVALVALGSGVGTVEDAVDTVRARGRRVGVLRISSFRPFPVAAVRSALKSCAGIAVLDRADAPGGTPPLYADVTAACTGLRIPLHSVVCGLGGRDVTPDQAADVFEQLAMGRLAHRGYLGLREAPCHD